MELLRVEHLYEAVRMWCSLHDAEDAIANISCGKSFLFFF